MIQQKLTQKQIAKIKLELRYLIDYKIKKSEERMNKKIKEMRDILRIEEMKLNEGKTRLHSLVSETKSYLRKLRENNLKENL